MASFGSHPYWPQPALFYRPRKRTPVPAYGNGYFSVDPANDPAQPVAKRQTTRLDPRRGAQGTYAFARRPYGSLSPKTDWSTPRYIRDEMRGAGLLGYGADEVSVGTACAKTLQDSLGAEIANFIANLTKVLPANIEQGVGNAIAKKIVDGGKLAQFFDAVQNTGKAAFVAAFTSDIKAAVGEWDGGGTITNIVPVEMIVGGIFDYLFGKLQQCAAAAGTTTDKLSITAIADALRWSGGSDSNESDSDTVLQIAKVKGDSSFWATSSQKLLAATVSQARNLPGTPDWKANCIRTGGVLATNAVGVAQCTPTAATKAALDKACCLKNGNPVWGVTPNGPVMRCVAGVRGLGCAATVAAGGGATVAVIGAAAALLYFFTKR